MLGAFRAARQTHLGLGTRHLQLYCRLLWRSLSSVPWDTMHARAKTDHRLSTANIVFGLNDKQINRIQRQISGEWKYDPSLDVLSIDESLKTADDRNSVEARLERSGSGWNLILTEDEMNIIEASYAGKDSREGERTTNGTERTTDGTERKTDGTEQGSYNFAKVPSVMTSTDVDVRSGTLDGAPTDEDIGVHTTTPHQSTLKVSSACSLTHDAGQNLAFIDSSGTNEDVLSIDQMVRTRDSSSPKDEAEEEDLLGLDCVDGPLAVSQHTKVRKQESLWDNIEIVDINRYDSADPHQIDMTKDTTSRSGMLDGALTNGDIGASTTSPHQSTLKVSSACSLTRDAGQNLAFIDSSGTNEDVLLIDQMVRTRDSSSPNDEAEEEHLLGLDCVDGVAQHTKVRKQESLWDNVEIDEIHRHNRTDPNSSGLNMIFGPLGATMGFDKNFRAPSPPPEPLYDIHASIEVMTTTLRTQARLVENLADHYVIPMKRRHEKGTHVTLAEMARCMRIDRLLEVLEGAVWLEKKLVGWGETTGQDFNATQVQVMMTAVGGIRKTSDRLQALLGKKDGSSHSTTLSLTSDPEVEALISQIHDAVEELLLYVRSALRVKTEHVNFKKELKTRMEQQTNLQKIEVLLASLPQKYIRELEEDFR